MSTSTIRGRVADQTGAVIPGATITIATSSGKVVQTVTSDSSGSYVVNGLAPGTYIVSATFAGFAPFSSSPIPLAAGQLKRVAIAMAVEAEQQSVTVTDEGEVPQVSVDAGSNASAVVLKGKDLEALSDDPDELQNELEALAGPAAGPNGGQVYIDGFTGGTLPPKSAIREIRINQNPFSAEFDRIGYGRIEILTKPGTDVLHGRGFLQGNDSNFNSGNPFATPPSYHSLQYNGTISGSFNKKTSFFLSVEGRDNPDANIYSVEYPVLQGSTWVAPSGPTTGGLYETSNRIEVAPRIDLQLGDKNTLTLRYQFERNTTGNVLGSSQSLPTQATGTSVAEQAFQFDDSQIINDHMVMETLGQYRFAPTTTTSVSAAPTISLPGYFTAGGNTNQFSVDHSTHIELHNITTMTVNTQTIKVGTWLRDNRDANFANSQFNGSFSFPTLAAYIDTLNGTANGESIAAIAASCPSTQTGGCTPNKLTYTQGPESYLANVFDGALFVQDDWKVNQFLTLSGGLRWETQNHVADHSDFGPRLAFAYALDGHKHKGQAKTVVRGGYGFFFTRFPVNGAGGFGGAVLGGGLLNLEQNNGGPKSQTTTVVTNPTCYSGTSLSAALAQSGTNCGSGTSANREIEVLASNYHSPVNEELGTSLERQLTKASTLTLTYIHSYGVHQVALRDSNAYEPGTYVYGSPTLTGVRPNPSLGVVEQIFPEAIFKQNQLIVNLNARFTPNLSVTGFYTFNHADSDVGTASNSYNLQQDYGRASFVRQNMVFLMGSYSGKWGITYNPFLVAQSGSPFNITTDTDLTGDDFFNNRPAYAANTGECSSSTGQFVQTTFGCLDTNPQASAASGATESLVAPYTGNSPSAIAVNLRVSRSWGIGPKTASSVNGPPPGGGGGIGGGGGRGPGGGGGGMGGGFGGGGFGGGGGMRGGGGGGGNRGGMSGTGHKYALNFSAQALNLFNDVDLGKPVGSITPTPVSGPTGVYSPGARFDTSTNLAGGLFASPTGSAVRRIFVQASFQF